MGGPDPRFPRHIGIIMDGNGRWARERGELRVAGHREGMVVLKRMVEACKNLGIGYLTVYAFSTENWKRPQREVAFLLRLLQSYIRSELDYLRENDVALRFIGAREGLSPKILGMMEEIEEKTAGGQAMTFSIAFNYGGRQEILEAAKKLALDAAAGMLDAEGITLEDLEARLYTAGMPDPDLIIRTSGEFRTSNFLLWQSAYAEYYITPVLWPDFTEDELMAAISSFGKRERRFGGL